MPAEITILAASSELILRKVTSFRGTKQMKPVGGTMPVGMKTVTRSVSPPGLVRLISPLVSPVTNTSDQRPFDGNSIRPTFWKPCWVPAVETTDSKICFKAR